MAARSKVTFRDIEEIKRANRDAGFYFFEPDTMRFFRSRVLPTVYAGRYFVTSEQFIDLDGEAHPRLYTIREAKPGGNIGDVGGFQAYPTAADARRQIKRLRCLSINREEAQAILEVLEVADPELLSELAQRVRSIAWET